MINDIKQSFKQGSILTKLIYINLTLFILVKFVGVFSFLYLLETSGPYEIIVDILALPANTQTLLREPWSILTYMFLHENFIHILFNLIWLYFSGRIFTKYLTSKQLLSTYFLGGIFGGVLYIVSFNIFPVFQDSLSKSVALGASASVLSILIAIATYVPNYSVHINFIGRVKLKYIALVCILLDFLSIPKGNAGGHIAHLGGALYGYLYIQELKNGRDWSKGLNQIINIIVNTFKSPREELKNKKRRTQTDNEWIKQKSKSDNEINQILDKISKSGYDSLNKKEKDTLFNASKK